MKTFIFLIHIFQPIIAYNHAQKQMRKKKETKDNTAPQLYCQKFLLVKFIVVPVENMSVKTYPSPLFKLCHVLFSQQPLLYLYLIVPIHLVQRKKE